MYQGNSYLPDVSGEPLCGFCFRACSAGVALWSGSETIKEML